MRKANAELLRTMSWLRNKKVGYDDIQCPTWTSIFHMFKFFLFYYVTTLILSFMKENI